jgi:hypothetical protein
MHIAIDVVHSLRARITTCLLTPQANISPCHMTERYPAALIISRDGAMGILLTDYEGTYGLPNRDAIGLFFRARLTPRSDETRLVVRFSGWTSGVRLSAFDLPDVPDDDHRRSYFAEAAIGDYLDEVGLPPFTPSGTEPTAIDCYSERTASWDTRPRAGDEAIERYLEAKVFWSWKYELGAARFSHSDALRLKAPIASMQRIAQLGEGERWDGSSSLSSGQMQLIARPSLIRARTTRPAAATAHQGGLELLARLSAPRYAGPHAHWARSIDLATQSGPDLANAVKEAVCAVEGLCRLLTKKSTATLGELINELRVSRRIDPALAKSLEGVWGWASNEPGVRHGSASASTLNHSEAQFAIRTSEAAIALLLDIDH